MLTPTLYRMALFEVICVQGCATTCIYRDCWQIESGKWWVARAELTGILHIVNSGYFAMNQCSIIRLVEPRMK